MQGQAANLNSERMELEIEAGGGPYPEERLWMAVVIQAVEEYEMWLKRIQARWLLQGEPVNRAYYFELRAIRQECSHQWFHAVCSLADIAPDNVFRKFQQLDRKYGLINVKFDDRHIVAHVTRRNRKKSKRYA